jgi:hypothetical protein
MLTRSSNELNGRLPRFSTVPLTEVPLFPPFHSSRSRELPGNYPFVVQQGYIDECIKEWRSPAHILCKAVYNTVSDYLKCVVKRHFATFGQGTLEYRIRRVTLTHTLLGLFMLTILCRILIQDHLKSCLAKTQERIDWLLNLEDKPFSLNTHYLSDYKSKFLAYYRGARRKNNHSDIMNSIKAHTTSTPSSPIVSSKQTSTSLYGVSKVLSGLTEMGFNGVQANDLPKLLRADSMEPAVEIMADVRAYFQGKLYTLSLPINANTVDL